MHVLNTCNNMSIIKVLIQKVGNFLLSNWLTKNYNIISYCLIKLYLKLVFQNQQCSVCVKIYC